MFDLDAVLELMLEKRVISLFPCKRLTLSFRQGVGCISGKEGSEEVVQMWVDVFSGIPLQPCAGMTSRMFYVEHFPPEDVHSIRFRQCVRIRQPRRNLQS